MKKTPSFNIEVQDAGVAIDDLSSVKSVLSLKEASLQVIRPPSSALPESLHQEPEIDPS
jgi:hypothetical protein